MYYKIDCNFNDGYVEYLSVELLRRYTKYLGKDLVKLLKKLKDTKPEFITKKEKELIMNSRDLFNDIQDSLNDIYDTIEDDEEDEEDEKDEKD